MTTDQAVRRVIAILHENESAIVALRGGGRRYFDGPDAQGHGPAKPTATQIRQALLSDHVTRVWGVDLPA